MRQAIGPQQWKILREPFGRVRSLTPPSQAHTQLFLRRENKKKNCGQENKCVHMLGGTTCTYSKCDTQSGHSNEKYCANLWGSLTPPLHTYYAPSSQAHTHFWDEYKKKGEGRKDIQKIYKDVKHVCAKVKCAAPVKRACAAIIIRESLRIPNPSLAHVLCTVVASTYTFLRWI